MKFIDWIEYWHNKASDRKLVWFPVQFLKPEPNRPIDLKLKIKMILCFTPYFAIFSTLRAWIFFAPSDLDVPVQTFVFADVFAHKAIWSLGFCIVWCNLVTAPLWNRRAKRLAI